MNVLTMEDYKATGDLLGAYKRFEETSISWKKRWWAVVEEIHSKHAFWLKHFIIDPINRVLKRITKGRLPKYSVESRLAYNVKAEGCGAYIVQHFDASKHSLWIKCGKANDAKTRLDQHFKVDYKGVAMTGTVLAWFPCTNSNHALCMENLIRDYYEKKGYTLLGNDRFTNLVEVTEEDLRILELKASELAKLF